MSRIEASHRASLTTLVLSGLWLLVLVVLIRSAWASDDAFITLRCVDNAIHGLGLTFNPGERVQAFSHPLWAILLIPLHSCLDAPIWELCGLGIACSVGALVTASRGLESPSSRIALLLLFLSSKALVDFTTSGLENSLNYLLMAVFVREWWLYHEKRGSVLSLATYAGLLLLNRIDMGLLIAPALLALPWRERSSRWLYEFAFGLSPFLAWEVLSLLYYGFPLPNTAYAKLGAQVPGEQLWQLGVSYYADSITRDWITLPLIALGILMGLRRRRDMPLAIGLALYLAYVLKIGGDFMSGRFFSVPAFVAILLLCKEQSAPTLGRILPIVCLSLSLLSPSPPLLNGNCAPADRGELLGPHGVADERAFFCHGTSLIGSLDTGGVPTHKWAQNGLRVREEAPPVRLATAIGMVGYFAGPRVHILDRLGLSDPLLARLPSVYTTRLRAGHFRRRIPAGYEESLRSQNNQLENTSLHVLYDKLLLITRGDLWSRQRFAAIWAANTGHLSCVEADALRAPGDVRVGLPINGKAKTLAVYAEHSIYVVLPPQCSGVRSKLADRASCDLVWMREGVPGEITRLRSEADTELRVPEGADGLVLLREGSLRKCIVEMRALCESE